MVKILSSLFLIATFLIADRAIGNPIVVTLPEPQVAYTPELPASLYIKEVVVTRASKRKIDVAITLRGDPLAGLPENIGLDYRVYFDIDGFEIATSTVLADNFKEDQFVSVFRNPGRQDFRTYTRAQIAYRSKVRETSVDSLKITGDKVSFSISSELFSVPNIKIRGYIQSLVKKGSPQQENAGKSTVMERIQRVPIFDLPEKDASST